MVDFALGPFASVDETGTMAGMSHVNLQLALDEPAIETAAALTGQAAPLIDILEVGTPLLVSQGVAAIRRLREALGTAKVALFADTKISDEGATIARLCYEAGADALSVVDGASTATLHGVRDVADEMGRQLWVDLLHHSNPVVRARTLAPFVDGFVLYRPVGGLPPLLVEGLLSVDRPFRLAGGLTLGIARRALAAQRPYPTRGTAPAPLEGIIVGRAITAAPDVPSALRAFHALCRDEER